MGNEVKPRTVWLLGMDCAMRDSDGARDWVRESVSRLGLEQGDVVLIENAEHGTAAWAATSIRDAGASIVEYRTDGSKLHNGVKVDPWAPEAARDGKIMLSTICQAAMAKAASDSTKRGWNARAVTLAREGQAKTARAILDAARTFGIEGTTFEMSLSL